MFKQLNEGVFHSKWNFLRLFQLTLAIMVLIQAITDHHYLLVIPALFILYMALSNSCQACRVPGHTVNDQKGGNVIPDNIEFIEIKNKK